MSRAVPATLLVLALASAPVLSACGDDGGTGGTGASGGQGGTTVAPAGPGVPSSTTGPVPATPAPAPGVPDADGDPGSGSGTTTLGAPGGPPPTATTPTITEVQRPARALRCPDGSARGGTAGDWDARELLGLSTARAQALARRNGCTVRVVVRDGQELIRTMDYSNARVNVTETTGRVVALDGIG